MQATDPRLPPNIGDWAGATQLGQGYRGDTRNIKFKQFKYFKFKYTVIFLKCIREMKVLRVLATLCNMIHTMPIPVLVYCEQFLRVLFAVCSFCLASPAASDTPGPANPLIAPRERAGPCGVRCSFSLDQPSLPARAEASGKGLTVLRGQERAPSGARVYGGCKAVTYLEFRVQLVGALWRPEESNATATSSIDIDSCGKRSYVFDSPEFICRIILATTERVNYFIL